MEDKNSLQLISQVLVSRDRKIQNYTYYVILGMVQIRVTL